MLLRRNVSPAIGLTVPGPVIRSAGLVPLSVSHNSDLIVAERVPRRRLQRRVPATPRPVSRIAAGSGVADAAPRIVPAVGSVSLIRLVLPFATLRLKI